MGGDLINIYYTHKVSFDKAMKEKKVGRRGGAPRAVWRVYSFRKWLSNRNLQLQGAAGTGVHRSSAPGTARRQAWLEPAKQGCSGRNRSYSLSVNLTEFL